MVKRMMKMATLFTLSVFLFCCSAVVSKDTCDLYAAVKANVTVSLNYALKQSDHLRWKRGDLVIFDRRGTKVTEGKMDDVFQNGSLKLTNVNKNESYTSEVYDEDGKQQNSKNFHLCVLDPVLKPAVTFKCDDVKGTVKFTCKADKQPPGFEYEWTENDKVLKDVKTLTLPDKVAKEVESTFKCRVFNKVSSMTSDPVKQDCYKGVFPGLPEEVFGINIWIIVGGGAGIVVVLIIITIVCCVQNRRKRQMHLRDEEELRLRFTHQNQNHHQHAHQQPHAHNHHHHHDHQPAGHTGPRQHRSKQPRNQQRPRDQNHSGAQPQPSPRRPAQVPKAADTDDEKPPPLPQPRKKAPKTPRA